MVLTWTGPASSLLSLSFLWSVVLAGQDDDRGDPQDVAFDGLAHPVVAEDDVEGLVPGDGLQVAGDGPADIGVEDDVEVGEFGQVEDDVPAGPRP